jgi:hypothetical protein
MSAGSGENLGGAALIGASESEEGRVIGRLRLWKAAFALLGVLALWWALNPASARAGTYTVIECDPDTYGVNSAADAEAIGSFFSDGSSYMTWSTSGCAQQGNHSGLWLQAFGNAVGGSVYTTLGISAPSGAYINGGSFHYSGWGDGFDTWGHAAYFLNDSQQVIQSWGGGNGNQPRNGFEQIAAGRGDGRTIRIDQSCPQPAGSVCTGEDNISIKSLALQLVDSSPPRIAALSGSLVDSPISHGKSGLRIQVDDAGSGVRAVTVDVNGQPIAAPDASCPGIVDGNPVRTRPCGNMDSTISVDTERTPWRDGSNALRICASDLSTGGPRNTTCEERNIQVDNSCPDSSGASAEADSISAGLENPKTGELKRTDFVRSTQSSTIGGNVTGDGSPVRGASVCVYEQVDEPAGIMQLVQVAKSTSNGQFRTNLPPGPTRTLAVAYRYGDHQIGEGGLHLDSSVQPTLSLTRRSLENGKSVGFRGHLPGPHADGVAVVLQARVGNKWRTFKQVTSEQDGGFRGKYRFTQTHGSVLYIFRALVKKQGGYPYSEGASRKRTVEVRG